MRHVRSCQLIPRMLMSPQSPCMISPTLEVLSVMS